MNTAVYRSTFTTDVAVYRTIKYSWTDWIWTV